MYRAGELLKEVLTRAHVDPEAPQTRIYQTWDQILGADLAGRARLRDIDRGRLLVEVDHPAWIQLIQMRQRTILRRVQRQFPVLGVKRLHLVVGAPPADRREPYAAPPVGAPAPGQPPGQPPDQRPDRRPAAAGAQGGTVATPGAAEPGAATPAAGAEDERLAAQTPLPGNLRRDTALAATLGRLYHQLMRGR